MSLDTTSEVKLLGEDAPKGGTDKVLTPITHVVLVIWTLVTMIPVLWVLASSLKTDNEIFVDSWRLPASLQFQNYARAWNEANFSNYFLNSLIVVGVSTVLVMLLGSMAAYALARYEFPLRGVLLGVFVMANAVPMFVALVPLFGIMKNYGFLTGSRPMQLIGLICVYTAWALSFTVFFLTAFFKQLPKEVYEAAFVDGAGHFKTFFLIMLPMARPGLVSVGIFNVLGLWNQYLIPLFLNPNPKNYVITQGLAKMASDAGYAADYSGLFAGLIIGMLPVVVMYFIFQRQIQTGMTAGAIK